MKKPNLLNLNKARKLMKDKDTDALLTNSRHHVYYTSDYLDFDQIIMFDSQAYSLIPRDSKKEAYLIAPHSGRFILIDFPTWIEKKLWYGRFYVKGGEEYKNDMVNTPIDGIIRAINELDLSESKIGIEENLLPLLVYESIKKELPKITLIGSADILRDLRMIKNGEEVRRLEKATKIVEKSILATIDSAEQDMKEYELKKVLEKKVIEEGGSALYTQITAGNRGAYGPNYATDKMIKKEEIIRIDASAIYKEYVSDICRVFTIGKATEKQKKYFDVTLEAEQAAINAIHPGIRAKDIFKAGLEVPLSRGFKDYFRHHVGHGIGLEAHEAPMLGPTNERVIEENMVLCVETPYYVWGLGGFAPEDTVVVTKEGYRYFSNPELELIEK